MAPPNSREPVPCTSACRRLFRRRPASSAYFAAAAFGWAVVGVLRVVGAL